MPIRPIDIRRKEFKSGFRGYEANQVDDFLDAVADEFERNYTENQRMREEVSSLRDRLQQFEDLEGSIRAALVHAEQAANDLRRAATQEAESMKQSAQREADFTIREAQSRSHQMLADSSARIERVQESYEALQEAKRTFVNEFRHLLKTYMETMDNMEVATAREIEASLRERLDTESIAVVREAAQEEATEEPDTTHEIVEPDEEPAAFAEPAEEDPGATQRLEPAEGEPEVQESESEVDEQPTEVSREGEPSAVEPSTEEPQAPEVTEPEVEPSTAEAVQEPPVSEPDAADEVVREEPSLAEESSSQEFFDTEQSERQDSRIFRASRFLRRRE
ncbi:MAG: DivIVA domain-containing protein [Actinomycetota bacterium]|nr:DivIVA domain-containing protein [Actinomycetota bacterium]